MTNYTSAAAALIAGCAVTVLSFNAAAQQSNQGSSVADRWSFGLDVGTRWESNINLGSDDEVDPEFTGSDAELDDFTTSVGANLSFSALQSTSRELDFTLSTEYNRVADYSDLSSFITSLDLDYRGEFGSAFTAPWYSVNLGYSLLRFPDSRIREGDMFEAELMVGKRFSPSFGISGGARFMKRNQDNDDRLCPDFGAAGVECAPGWRADEVFDQERWGIFVHADWFFNEKTSVFAEYSYWDGDEDATVPLRNAKNAGEVDPDRVPGWLNRQDIFAHDPAIGAYPFTRDDGTSGQRPWIVWKVDAIQHNFEAGISHRLTDKISVDFTAAYMTTSDVKSVDRTDLPKSLEDYENTALMLTFHFTSG